MTLANLHALRGFLVTKHHTNSKRYGKLNKKGKIRGTVPQNILTCLKMKTSTN